MTVALEGFKQLVRQGIQLRVADRVQLDLTLEIGGTTEAIFNGKVLQLRLEALNAFNHPLFAAPNLTPTAVAFGQVSAQNNYARRVQAMVKFLF